MKHLLASLVFAGLTLHASAQSLINLDFGVGTSSRKTGFAATGESTNDFWNLYRHYDPKYVPGSPLILSGTMTELKFADDSLSSVSVAVTNAPGVWGNASGDPMYDSYVFAHNGSNIVVTLTGLAAGQYHLYLYGHADPDVTGEQNSVFTVRSGTNVLGPIGTVGSAGWKAASSWGEKSQYVLFRDLPVLAGVPIQIDVAPGANGVGVLNGLQILSRGTSPPRLTLATAAPVSSTTTNLIIREVNYVGRVSDQEARFDVILEIESLTTNEISTPLFAGDVALVVPKLPEALRMVSSPRQYWLHVNAPGRYTVPVQVVARIARAEPWNQISFVGPPAVMAAITAQASVSGVEMQLLSGTQLDTEPKATSKLRGVLGGDRTVAMRWQSQATEITRKSLVTVDTTASAQVTPAAVKFSTLLRYEILQAPLARLTIAVPSGQALTKLVGEQIRDWQLKPDGARQLLNVEFIKPVEKSYTLTLSSEQTVERTSISTLLTPPQPLAIERESGSFTISASDTLVEIDTVTGLRQVNAGAGAIAAYRFHGRPIEVAARLKRIEPVVHVVDRATLRLEETRLLVTHALALNVERAGIYAVALTPPAGFAVSEVRGDGVDDWKLTEGILQVTFTNRVLGARSLTVVLEQALQPFPDTVVIQPLTVIGSTNLSLQIEASASGGIRMKTSELMGLREVPVATSAGRSDERLAFTGEQVDWKLTLAVEKLSARVVAEVFNLITIGDGLVGGSATIRYGIFNQGLQEFRVSLPAHWRNLEFTAPNIRRKDLLPRSDPRVSSPSNEVTWLISLQDKAWGAYTLVVTYDYQFDPRSARLDLAGAHAPGVEREAGSVGVMSAGGLKLDPQPWSEPLRAVDESELSEIDRALCTRPLRLAYKYAGTTYALAVEVTRFEQLTGLDAIADRTELTSVLNDQGQMLTQASFMVKNNEKQFQRFQLPAGAEFWSSTVNGQPARPERDGEWVLVPLPREANRDAAFAVDIIYAQKIELQKSRLPRTISLRAPLTDVPNTYAEWQLFVPMSHRLSSFGGNMMVAPYTTYELRDAWREFVQFWGNAIDRHLKSIIFAAVLAGLAALVFIALRRGAKGFVSAVVVLMIVSVLASMMLPALSKAKARAQRINSVSNLKQIGLAALLYAKDHEGKFPNSFEEMREQLVNDKILVDHSTGQRFTWIGAGKADGMPDLILAYSRSENGGIVALADGSVQQVSSDQLDAMLRRDASVAAQATAVTAAPPGVSTPGGQVMNLPHPVKLATTGVRPIRIDIPRIGRAFTFTKVLNVANEPLAVQTSIMKIVTYRTWQMIWQTTLFLCGLASIWVFWHRRPRRTFFIAVGVALVLVAVAGMLLTWRALGIVLMVLPPLIVASIAVWLVRRAVPPRKLGEMIPPIQPGGPVPSTAALVLFTLIFCSAPGATAQVQSRPSPAKSVTVTSAHYVGTVRDKFAQLDATVQLSSLGSNQTVMLWGDDTAIEQFEVTEGSATLLREAGSVSVLLQRGGTTTLKLKLVAKVGGEVAKRQLKFTVPPALSSTLELNIDEVEADVDFPSAVAFARTNINQQTRVSAVLGAVDRVEMNWTPRVKRTAEIAATVFVQNTAMVSFSEGVVNTRALFEYQITQGELRQVRVRLPAGHRLLRVEGAGIRTWELSGDGTVLTVDLVKGVSPSYRLTVELEKGLENLPATARVELPHALDVKRETGLIAVRASEELALTIESLKELQRVDVEEFVAALTKSGSPPPLSTEGQENPSSIAGFVGSFRFSRTDFEVTVRAERIQPQVEAVMRNAVRIGSTDLLLQAHVDYTIRRAGVFTLRLGIPAGYKIASVTGGPIQQWVEKNDNGGRVMEVGLPERTIGKYSLDISLLQSYASLPPSLSLAGVQPLDAQKSSGFVVVSAEAGVATRVESFDGLTEIPAASLGWHAPADGSGATLAFKQIGNQGGPLGGWRLTVGTETVTSWVRAEVANHLTVSETLISGRSTVRYEIAHAPVKEFRLRIPATFKNVDITGPSLRRRDQNGEEWRVELQGKVRGRFTLHISWEIEKSAASNVVEFAGIQTTNVERETGFVVVAARPTMQVSERALGELLTRIDFNELPEWLESPGQEMVLAFKYLRPGYRLLLDVKRYGAAETLQALIESARLTTVVADDGQMMTEMALSVRNHGRQHLEVELPGGVTNVWSAFVAGEAVRPNVRQGKLLLPLERSTDDIPVSVELTFVSAAQFPKGDGPFALQSPTFDVPVKNARWDLYLPPDYDYSKFEGSMTKVAESAPIVQTFSVSGYLSQQTEKAELAKAERKSELSSVQSNLQGGNVREAVSTYNRAKGKALGDEQKEIVAIEKQVRLVQGSNLIQAQRDYFNENNARFHGLALFEATNASASQTVQAPQMDYDTDVAGLQWTRLEAAQQVAKAKVSPLHINLPTRGVKISFLQVLQTEVQKPMTVTLQADNTKVVGSLPKLLWSILGFGLLWLGVAIVSHKFTSDRVAVPAT